MPQNTKTEQINAAVRNALTALIVRRQQGTVPEGIVTLENAKLELWKTLPLYDADSELIEFAAKLEGAFENLKAEMALEKHLSVLEQLSR